LFRQFLSIGIKDNTIIYITPKIIILYEVMKPIEHVLLHAICVLSRCRHSYKVIFIQQHWTYRYCLQIYHLKKNRFNAIFYN